MAKFCGKCGTKLDDVTELCPRCSAGQDISARNHPLLNSEEEKALSRKEKKEERRRRNWRQ